MSVTTSRKGFTLIELLVVIAIIAILAAILFPLFTKAREKARQSTCQSNVRQMLVAIQMNQNDNDGRYPDMGKVYQVVQFPPKCITCPTYGAAKGAGYGFNSWLTGKVASDVGMLPPQETVIGADSTGATMISALDMDARHTGKGVVGYGDGHVSLEKSVNIPAMTSNDAFDDITDYGGMINNDGGDNSYIIWSSVIPATTRINNRIPTGWVSPAFTMAGLTPDGTRGGIMDFNDRGMLDICGSTSYAAVSNYGGGVWPGGVTDIWLRIPVNNATTNMASGMWVVAVPFFGPKCWSGDYPGTLDNWGEVNVVDTSGAKLASFRMEARTTGTDFKLMGQTVASAAGSSPDVGGPYWIFVGGSSALPSICPGPASWHQSGGGTDLRMNVTFLGNVATGSVSATIASNLGNVVSGGVKAPAMGGDIHRPGYVEFRVKNVTTEYVGRTTGASWTLMYPAYGGGVKYGMYP